MSLAQCGCNPHNAGDKAVYLSPNNQHHITEYDDRRRSISNFLVLRPCNFNHRLCRRMFNGDLQNHRQLFYEGNNNNDKIITIIAIPALVIVFALVEFTDAYRFQDIPGKSQPYVWLNLSDTTTKQIYLSQNSISVIGHHYSTHRIHKHLQQYRHTRTTYLISH